MWTEGVWQLCVVCVHLACEPRGCHTKAWLTWLGVVCRDRHLEPAEVAK